jgi:hypothetical protein
MANSSQISTPICNAKDFGREGVMRLIGLSLLLLAAGLFVSFGGDPLGAVLFRLDPGILNLAQAVVQRQPRTGARIFPASTDAISAAFTRACKVLGISGLHFHDLRHDGVSRLFEMGWTIPHVAAVSGHRSWQSLKRYTHVRQRGDKYAGWKKNPSAKSGAVFG